MNNTNNNTVEINKMGVMPIKKLVFNMSVPMMLSMFVQSLYNIVDSIFVSRISEDALTAVSVAFPLQSLLIAVGAGTGVGINAMLSKALGEKDSKKANKTACNGGFIYVLSYLVFLVLGLTVVRSFYEGQVDESGAQIVELGVDYLSVVMVFSFGLFAQFFFERLLTSTGKTFYSMISQLCGAITNIILDPIMIFGLFGMPKLGVAGAAVATVIGQCVAGLIAFIFNIKFNTEVKLSYKGFKPSGKVIGGIYAVGLPSIIMQSIGSIMVYCIDIILLGFTSTATAVFGVYFKLQSFFFMPIFGLNNGITPIIAYNYGAKNRKRMLKTIKLSMVIAGALMSIGILGFEIIPDKLLGIFKASDDMIKIGTTALRIIAVHFFVAWFCIIAGTVFQALGKAVYSLIVSVMRQLVVLVPAAFILAKVGGLNAVWWAFPIAEVMSLAISVICLINIYKKIIKPLPEGDE